MQSTLIFDQLTNHWPYGNSNLASCVFDLNFDLYWYRVVQLGSSGPLHLSHKVLQPTWKMLNLDHLSFCYLSRKTLPGTRVKVVIRIGVAWVSWEVQFVYFCQGDCDVLALKHTKNTGCDHHFVSGGAVGRSE